MSDARSQQQQQHDDTASDNSSELSSPRKSTKQHPLEHAWTLWFHNPSRKTNAANYFSYLKQVYKFNTIEQFWGLYNHVMTPSKLGVGCTYYMVCFFFCFFKSRKNIFCVSLLIMVVW